MAGLELLLDDRALGGGEGAVVGAADWFAGQFVKRAREPLSDLARVDEENCGIPVPNQVEQTRVNCVPDGDAAGLLRSGSAGNLFDRAKVRHIFNWNFNSQF